MESGERVLIGIGQTMKAMQGKANPQVVNELLKQKLVQKIRPIFASAQMGRGTAPDSSGVVEG